jgi:hypothetical protein
MEFWWEYLLSVGIPIYTPTALTGEKVRLPDSRDLI